MKTLKTNSGFSITAFEFADLRGKAKENAINSHVQFLIEIGAEEYQDSFEKSEKMQTPWFLPEILWEDHSSNIIDNIEANGYLFDLNGDLLPITQYTGKHPKTGTFSIRIFGEETPCTIS